MCAGKCGPSTVAEPVQQIQKENGEALVVCWDSEGRAMRPLRTSGNVSITFFFKLNFMYGLKKTKTLLLKLFTWNKNVMYGKFYSCFPENVLKLFA